MSNRRKDQATYDPEVRAQALELAGEVGAAEASRRIGVPAATIRSWLHREGRSRPPAGVDVQDWAAQRREGARHAWEGATDALGEVSRWLDEGSPSKAQSAATTAAILMDKSALLLRSVEEAEANAVRLAEGQAELVAEVMRAAWAAAGVPLGPGSAAARVVADLLRGAQDGQVVSGGTDPAVRAELLRTLSDVELTGEAERRGLRAQVAGALALPSGGPAANAAPLTAADDLPATGEPTHDEPAAPAEVVEEGHDLPAAGLPSPDGRVWTTGRRRGRGPW